MIKHVDYIWNTTSFPTWNKNNIIDTGIFAESDCEIRVAYQGAGASVDRIVGFSQESTAGDNDDFRIFHYSNGSFDWGGQRVSNLGGFTSNGVDYDITMGNGWLYNNLTSSYIYQGSTATYNHNCTIRVDVGGQKVKSLQIKNGGVIVFDAFAVLDNSNNVVGLYDTVSDTMFTNTALTLTYGQIINVFTIAPENMSFDYSGGTSVLTITAEDSWTASTNDSWLNLSSTAGTGDSVITVTTAANSGAQRNGVVSVTDGSNTLTCTISQDKQPVFVKSDNIYIEDIRANKMYLNGALIYRNLIPTVVFDVDESSETIEYTGGTFNFTVYANKLWTITSPEWVTLSKTSGYSTNTITATVGPNEDTQRTGTITVSCNNTSKTISLTQSAAPHDYSKDYLTLNILTGGTIMWKKHNRQSPSVTISYSINNGNWVDITSDYSTSAPTISVNAGDKVRIKGNNNTYCATGTTTGATTKDCYNSFSGDTNARYNVYGNIMSLIYGDNFIGNNEFPDTNGWSFKSLFEGCKNVVSAKNLILPPTTLYMSSFRALFSKATNLVEGPELLAPTLAPACYSYIFGTTKITYVKCLATDISAAGCLSSWLTGVPSGGTLVKKAGVVYPSGASGIPSGWTVIDSE